MKILFKSELEVVLYCGLKIIFLNRTEMICCLSFLFYISPDFQRLPHAQDGILKALLPNFGPLRHSKRPKKSEKSKFWSKIGPVFTLSIPKTAQY